MKREGLAASSSAQASQPSRPANPFLFSHPRAWPTSSRRPSMPAQSCTTRVRCDAELLSLPAGPHLSAFLFIFFAPTHQPPVRPEADSVGRCGPGVTPGHGPCSPLRRAHATSRHRRMRRAPFHCTMSIAIGGMELGYKRDSEP